MTALPFPARFECNRRSSSTVTVTGALRAPVAPELSRTLEALIRRGERRVLLDLRAVDHIDAAGVGELVRAFNVTRAAGGTLRVAHANSRVRRVLQIAGLLTLLTTDDANPSTPAGNKP